MQRLRPTLPRAAAPSSTALNYLFSSTTTSTTRSFSTTSLCHPKSAAKRLAFEHDGIPPYPHGPSQWYKQANFGLYGHARIRFGNKVSEKNEIKTRRHWRANVKRKRLWSQALNAFVRTRITTRVLRTVDKVGGLDEYLLGDRPGRIKELGMAGWKLRWRVMQTEAVKERFRLQREKLGLPPKGEDGADGGLLVGVDGLPASAVQVAEQIQKFDDDLRADKEIGLGEETENASEEAVDDATPFMEERPPRDTQRL